MQKASDLVFIDKIVKGELIQMSKAHLFLKKFENIYYYFRNRSLEKKKIRDPRRVKILNQVTLSEEQKKEIDCLYKDNYGKKVPYDWHREYTSYTGKFDARYIPELIFIPEIEAKFIDSDYECLADKNLFPLLIFGIPNAKTAKIFLSCVNGLYRNESLEFIDREAGIKSIADIGEAFLKPTVNSGSGNGCSALNIKKGKDLLTGKSVEELLSELGDNFNIQEKIINCESLRRLNPSSLNTFRITTYIWKNKIHHFPLLLRIGRGGKALDNAHQGGMFIYVDEAGRLGKEAYTEFQERFTCHPDTKIEFDGYTVSETPAILAAACRAHARLPQIGMISWDITADDQGNIVFIEMNLRGLGVWISQMSSGKGAFGENTEEILRWVRK